MRLLVTGGAGFIGSNFIRWVLERHSSAVITNLDKLTYAGNLENLSDIQQSSKYQERYRFVCGDIADSQLLNEVLAEGFDAIVNFAAETHVDRSITSAQPFVHSNYLGTHALLEAVRKYRIGRFIQIGTDEVYGSAHDAECFSEDVGLRPSNPYAATKAAADLLVLSYVRTYRVPAIVLRCSNNYGPYQFPEKLIPLMIANALENKALPVYGDGLNVRDWIYVADHCNAIYTALTMGRIGEVYNVGGVAPIANLEVIQMLLKLLDKPPSLVRFVPDRPGHDRRYALDSQKLRQTLGWFPNYSFEQGLKLTIDWYLNNASWLARCRSGAYRDYYRENYVERENTFRALGVGT
jgi:dTDP-glucose 4,6-dehydratase